MIDGCIDGLAAACADCREFDDAIDRYLVDGAGELVAAWTYSIGNSLRQPQTGKLRQYVMLIVVGTVALTLLIRWTWQLGLSSNHRRHSRPPVDLRNSRECQTWNRVTSAA